MGPLIGEMPLEHRGNESSRGGSGLWYVTNQQQGVYQEGTLQTQAHEQQHKHSQQKAQGCLEFGFNYFLMKCTRNLEPQK